VFLSRIQINPQRRGAQRLLASPQRMHAAVLSAFPDPLVGTDGPRILWRLDEEPHRVFLYVVSPQEPDFVHLAEQAGWPRTEQGLTRPYSAFLESLAPDQVWAFRLKASPVRYLPAPGGGRARRTVHVTAAQQEAWLVEKSASIGGALAPLQDGGPSLQLTRRGTDVFSKGTSSSPVTLGWAQFDGLVRVVDADALRAALVGGIGPGKAYGCGLMTLARPKV